MDMETTRSPHPSTAFVLAGGGSLGAVEVGMLQVLVDYNLAIVDLERSKGTLLRYNNVVISSELN